MRIDPKRLADALTASRLLAAVALPALPLWSGARTLPAAAALLLWSWTSDALDGPLARRGLRARRTWLGDHDLEVDMAVSAGLALWLVETGALSAWLALAYGAAWAAVFAHTGLVRSLGMLVQAPIYAWFLVVAARTDAVWAAGLVGWIALAIALTWPRFPRQVVPEFLEGIRGLRRGAPAVDE